MNCKSLMLLCIFAVLCTAGTFTCKGESSSAHFTDDAKTPAK